jgi:hypothetical protein
MAPDDSSSGLLCPLKELFARASARSTRLGIAQDTECAVVLWRENGWDDLFTRFFTLSLFLGALSLSSLGLFGLYGAVVARSGATDR